MVLTPTWDIVYLALGTAIVVYSCIIDRAWTAKIILATYAAILATDAFGLLFESFLMNATYIDLSRGFADRVAFLAVCKLLAFAVTLVTFARKTGYSLELSDSESYFLNISSRVFYGLMSALLITTALLVYTTGSSFIFGAFGGLVSAQTAVSDTYQGAGTEFVRLIYENARWIFLVPAGALLFRIK